MTNLVPMSLGRPVMRVYPHERPGIVRIELPWRQFNDGDDANAYAVPQGFESPPTNAVRFAGV
jgi:hypothetical protein